jgi:hypothetical protein
MREGAVSPLNRIAGTLQDAERKIENAREAVVLQKLLIGRIETEGGRALRARSTLTTLEGSLAVLEAQRFSEWDELFLG